MFYFCNEITFQFTKEYSTHSSSVSIFVHAFILKKSLANFHFRRFPPVKSVIDLEGQRVSFPGLEKAFEVVVMSKIRLSECERGVKNFMLKEKKWAGVGGKSQISDRPGTKILPEMFQLWLRSYIVSS